MKQFKKIFFIFSALFLASVFAVCKDGDDDNSGGNGNTENAVVCTYTQSNDTSNYYVFYSDKTVEGYIDGKLEYPRSTLTYTGTPNAAGTVTLKTNTGATLLTFKVTKNGEELSATAYIGESSFGGTKYVLETSNSGNSENSTSCTITFASNGGIITTTTQTVKGNVQTALLTADKLGLMRTGYVFIGWSTTKNAATVTYQDGASVTVTKNLILYALWEAIPVEKWSVTFETNGGSIIGQQIVESGKTATEPSAPTKDGYAFTGWYSNSSLIKAFDFSTPITANITLYAKWEAIPIEKWTVAFETNGGSIIGQQIVEDGKTVVEPAAPTKDGYTFAGWYINSPLAKTFDFSTPIIASITLYAKWEAIPVEKWAVTFETNGGSVIGQQIVENGKTATEPSAPTKDGYTFVGWYSNSSLTKSFDFSTPINANITLYARWEAIMFMGFDNLVLIESGTDMAEITTKIFALTADTTLKFKGGINSVTLTTIASAMQTNDSVKIALDFSETTGITEWTNKLAGVKTLYAISLPNMVTSVQAGAFTDCTNLKAITVPCSITAYPYEKTTTYSPYKSYYNCIVNFTGTLVDWLQSSA